MVFKIKKLKKELFHYGTPRHSGRYPWGSGDEPYQRTADFRSQVLDLKKQGLKENEIAKSLGLIDKYGNGNIKALRNKITVERNKEDLDLIYQAKALKDKGYKTTKIGEIMDRNESTIRSWLKSDRLEKIEILKTTENILKEQVDQKKYLDVGIGVELHLGIKRTLLDAAIYDLEQNGYKTHSVVIQQVNTGKPTNVKVLTKDDVDYQDVRKNLSLIRTVTDWSNDGGETYNRLEPVKIVNSNRVQVRFDEDGGTDRDGMIQLRRGVPDLSLGDKKYAQVRIAVEGEKFMKGMAVYVNDDKMPDGIDIIYNSNKSISQGKEVAFKKYESDDPTNPFKTTIRQSKYIDEDGNEQLSSINKVGYSTKMDAGEEGYWDSWHSGKVLASQFLAKQDVDIAKDQLKLSYDIQKEKFDSIQEITNSAVRQRLLDSFADDCDSKAVHMEGAALPRQSSKVLLSIPSLKENEVYAPSYNNGESLILVRYPHAGRFEIPRVTVNNKNIEGKNTLGTDAIDAIGIHPKTAVKLSGADFDGDAVIAIPYSKRLKIESSLEGLKDFNPKQYKYPTEIINDPSFKDSKAPIHKMTDREKQIEMGGISNLITDMTIKGSNPDHIAKAVRHSMVVIDAQKHDLDYKASARFNNITELKKLYQGGAKAGASTLLSRATSELHPYATRPLRKGDPGYENVVRRNDYSVDKITGKKVYAINTREPYINKDGELITPKPRRKISTKMYEEDDAMNLLSKNPAPIEIVYGNYANNMKSLGNLARKESINIKSSIYSKSANITYKDVVEVLDAKLNNAKRNAPLERQAQALANSILELKKQANPNLTLSQLRKLGAQELEFARLKVGAGKQRIQITDKEWNAIQAGAITHQKLQEILNNSKLEDIQKLATPRYQKGLSPTEEARAKSMIARGYNLQQISDALGISKSTLSKL